jgi:hypothetical protein
MIGNWKQKRIVNRKYLLWLREVGCLLCSNTSAGHHIPLEGNASTALKTDDTRAIPLCHPHHQQYHTMGRETFALCHNIDYEFTIRELNRIWSERLSK